MCKIDDIVSRLTLCEKAGLCSGKDFWRTKGVERLAIPPIAVSDGPHGLRKQEEGADHLGIHDSIKAICFPAGCATAASFDRKLLFDMGELLGEECMAENVAVLLGPAVNIKRSPLCGRNFEYYSEDPFVSGELATAFTKGVQSKGVGVSVKHFAANNQEARRMSVSAKVSERALREIYLPAFESVVKDAKPKTVMCAYNRVNGVYASENEWLLSTVLRDEWGFEGFVVSDWYAVSDRISALRAGLDLEMPGGDVENDEKIVAAVEDGSLSEAVLDRAVKNILGVVLEYAQNKSTANKAVFDREKDHARAVEISAQCAVLLKNSGVLPLNNKDKILYVGEFAQVPRYQGGGSSHINSFRCEGALRFADTNVQFVRGFLNDGTTTEEDCAEAMRAAVLADTVVVFAGLPDSYESEGYDRKHMQLPESQNKIIDALCDMHCKVVVVLHNGSPVEMPWLDKVDAVLEMYLGGEGVGEACSQLLYGQKNPCGRLAETFPLCVQDNPSYLNFPGDINQVNYAEDIFVGYRYYESANRKVLFPFGYGLSYTQFAYENLTLSADKIKDGETLTVRVNVRNTGKCKGKEIVQLYVCDCTGETVRPIRELKGFEKIELAPNESATVEFLLNKRAFAYYSEDIGDWRCGCGMFEIQIGKSSSDIVLRAQVQIDSPDTRKILVNDDTTVEQLFANAATRAVMQGLLAKFRPPKPEKELGNSDSEMMRSAYMQAPLRTVRLALNMTKEQYCALLEALRTATK